MIIACDVHYSNRTGYAAGVCFDGWTAPAPARTCTA
jgi:hypothetical protein